MPRFLLLLTLAISPALAGGQARPDEPLATVSGAVGSKGVTTARLLAIIPSVGHGYAGEGGRGLAVAGGLVGIVAISGLLMAADCVGDALDAESAGECAGGPLAVATGIAFYGVWGWSIYDAGHAARRTNARAARRTQGTVTLGLTRRPAGRALNIGLRFSAP